jgi:hypothetical protein
MQRIMPTRIIELQSQLTEKYLDACIAAGQMVVAAQLKGGPLPIVEIIPLDDAVAISGKGHGGPASVSMSTTRYVLIAGIWRDVIKLRPATGSHIRAIRMLGAVKPGQPQAPEDRPR